MNVYDFDKTIYYGDSTADFYLFCLKRHKKILTLAPSLLGAFLKFYVFKKGTKTDFKEKMYRFLTYCDTEKDVNDFWKEYIGNIKPFYLEQKKDDDVIISASPEFLLKPVCKRLKIKNLMASKVDMHSGDSRTAVEALCHAEGDKEIFGCKLSRQGKGKTIL